MKTLADYNCAFPGHFLQIYKINHEKDYLQAESPIKEQIKLQKQGFSNEITIKNLQKRYRQLYDTPGWFTYEQWEKLVRYYCGDSLLCISCGEQVKLIIPDHIESASIGGSNWITNIQPICVNCNSKKRSEILDFRPDKGEFANILSYL